MKKKLKKNMVITQKEHDAWHKKHREYVPRTIRSMNSATRR